MTLLRITTLLFMVSALQMTDALRCLEGADCIRDASCEECEGVACTRIVSFNMEDNAEIAFTCLPHDTRTSFPIRSAQLEEEGCRHVGDRLLCVCYSGDYCNSSKFSSFFFLLITVLIWRFL